MSLIQKNIISTYSIILFVSENMKKRKKSEDHNGKKNLEEVHVLNYTKACGANGHVCHLRHKF